MADQHQGGTGNVVGRIAGKEGYVYLVDSDGTRHLVETDEAVRIGQTVETLGSSAVVITLTGSKSVSLGQNQELTLDRRLIKLLEEINEEGSLDEAVNFDLIAQALESGQSIDELLPAPAAGGENSPTSSSSAGASAARIERTAAEVTPESGFETAALVSDANNFVAPDTNEAVAQPLITPAGNSQPVTIGIDDFTIDEDEQYTLDLNQFFSDADSGQSLTFSVDNLPEGLVLDPATGIISGAPTNDSALLNNGAYSITVTATDNSGAVNGSATASFNLSVNNVNDNPSVSSIVNLGTIGEDSTITIPVSSLLAGVRDIDGDNLNVTSVELEAGEGALTVNDSGDYVYTPSANWNGEAVFGYVIGDGQGGQVTNTATLNISAVNDAPVAANDGLIEVEVNSSLTLDLLANDYDVDGDTLIITGVSARQGTVTINPEGTVTYTPNQDFIGRDVLSYTISDGNGGEAGSLALINIVVGNVAPVMAEDTSVSVLENSSQVGNFAASDADGNTITYSLSGSDADLFTIDSAGTLSFVSPPDFETNAGPFSVTITATDNGIGNLSDSQTLTVSVTNASENTAPILGADATVVVAENSMVVGNFAATDAEGDNITYTLSGADAGLFSIDISGNLTFLSPPDFELNPGPFNVTVTATDDGEGTLFGTQNITVNVTNEIENTAPVLGADTSIDVAENTTAVGNFAATDANGDSISYALSGVDAGLFTIDNSGNLSFLATPDFEANAGPFNVTVTAIDDGEGTLVDTQNVTVNIINVIENVAPTLGSDISIDVAENSTAVGNFAATDAEGDSITYTLSGADAALFTIDNSGNLSFLSAPDFELNPGPFDVTVIATDDGEGALFDTQNITVNVTNVIENTAPVLGADTSIDVAENTTAVGNFAATDAEGNNITYSLSGTDAALFNIDAAGNLRFVTAPDFEANSGPFSVTITATDDGEGGSSDTQNVIINITNVIENTAPVLGADASVNVAENTAAVGNFAATDAEGDNVTYTLLGADGGLFAIDNSGNLSFLTAPDFETNPGPFNLTITATDDGEGTLFDTQNVTVNITNVIENTAPILGADVSVDVAENITAVGNFTATDIDGDNITYTLSGADAELFSVDSAGNLSFLAAPDFETNAGPFNVTITATDDGEGSLFDTQNIIVSVTNVVENTSPVLGADVSVDVAENTTAAGNFAATDAEGNNIAYTLSGADAGLFAIDNNGNLSFLAAPDFETNAGPFNIAITATDDGEGTLFDTQNITVNVTNVIENTAPVLGADTSVEVAENTTAVGNFAATDAEGDNITYALSGTDATLFSIDAGGNLSFITAPDFEANPGPFSVTVTASDDGESALFDTQNITINVTNAIENTTPALGADTSIDVAENTTSVGNFAATDADGDNITYTLGGADAGLFSIDDSGNLSFITASDFETNAGPFNVTITATDDGEGALFDTQNITVNVTNIIENTAPVLGADTSVDVAENTAVVGNFATTDAEGDSVTYTLGGADAALFTIDTSGNLSFVSAPDFEANPGPFSVTITATDDGEGTLFDTQNVTVNIANVIENTAPVLGADTSVDIAENTTAVGNFAATDAESDNVTYALSGADAGLFTIDSTGNLAFLVAPDFETNPGPFNVTITATDDGEGTLFDTQNIAVSVTNVIENTAPVLGADTALDIAENSTMVGNFAATDAEGNSVTYTLSGADAGLFAIDNSGNLSLLAAPDFETDAGPFNVTITATDDGEATLLDTQNITVNVTNVIENTAPVLGADTSVDVAENITAVGNFAATDAEGNNVTYTLSGAHAGLFSIDTVGNLSLVSAPDFESDAGPFSVTITATDDGEGALFDIQNITVNIANVIENSAPVLGADTSIDVAENTALVGNFAAMDAEGDSITYTLSGADAGLFTIDNSGNLSFLTATDFETNPGPFNVTVTATDDGEGSLFDTQNVTVNVTNTIENTAPVLASDTSVDVAENATAVGNFTATDAEGNNIAYTLSGADAGLFTIDATGNLSFISAPDFETDAGPFNITVTATDDGEGNLFDTQNITINVTNIIENTAPVLGADTSVDAAENTTVVGNFASTDAEGNNLTYTLSGANAGLFSIDTAGNLSFISAPDFETNAGPFNVTITATDDGEGALFDTQNITVNVTNVIENTAPALGSDVSVDVVENTVSVGNFAATDAEGDNITYALSGTDAALFNIDTAGNLSFVVAPDFETSAGPFNVTITATDEGEGALFDTQNITINVTNVIENTAPSLGADTSVDVAENTTAVGNFAAADAEGDNIIYSLSGADAALFTIDTSGNLSFISAPDFEANAGPFSVTIAATDNGEGALFDTQNITVSVTNVIENTAPSLGANTSVDVAENTTTVGNFAATDAEGDNISYALSGADAGLFSIDAAGNLAFLVVPDFETNAGPFSVTITATDDGEGALFDTQNVTVNITNIIENTAPVLGADTSVNVAENTTAVGNFAATDAEGDIISYTLSGADAELFSIDAGGNLAFQAAPDFETNAGPFNVTITATDDGEGTLLDTQNITVNVTNVIENTAPVLGADTSINVAENTTTVGNFVATDAEGNNITYSLSGTDAALFNINAAGNLSFFAAPDFETNAGPFSVIITATDDGEGGLSDTQNITVSVTNIVENTAPVLGADTLIDIAENTTAVGNFAATDAEGDNVTYVLSGADAGLFAIDSAGNLAFLIAPDFETNPGAFNVTITATDDGEGTLFDAQNVTVNVTNVIENTVPVLGVDVSVDVAENTTVVGSFAAIDGDGDNVSYTLSGADAGLFIIDSAGTLSFLAAPDFETNAGPFNVTITATDDGEGTLFDTQNITVSVTNVIENTAPVLGADVSVDVAENTTAVGNFAATDAEGDSITYSLGGADAALFTIDTSGNLSFVSAPDFETNPGPFSVTVTATDGGEGTLFDSQNVTVNITNVIENTVPILGADTSVDITENTTAVGNFAATDAEGDNITYALSGADAGLFTIDSAGNLAFLVAPDFESNPGPFNVTITATDDGEGTLADTQNVTINVTNVIENTAPVLGVDTSVDVAENTTAVGNFAATDAEEDNVTYALSGADAGLFAIDNSGNLSFLAASDFETNPGPFNVTIIATDDGEGTLFDTQNITVNVTNVIENIAPVLGVDVFVDVAENITAVGSFAATDIDGDNITYTLSGDDAGLFSVDTAGNLSFLAVPDFETNAGPFNVTITATDNGEGNLFDTQNITVSITNVIENTSPVLGADVSVDVAENTTAVGNFAATDAEGNNVTYTLSGVDAALFNIDTAGNLSFIAAPDFEADPGPFNVTITATDDGEGALSDTQNITINITNIIENTAPALDADVSVDVAENATAVGNFAATDAEGDNVSYTLSGPDAGLFSIDSSGNLSFLAAPDFEVNSGPFNVTVTATDDGEGTLSDTQSISVNVTNVIENTPPVLGTDVSVDVVENTTAVGNFAATDAEGNNIAYTLSGPDAGLFTIDSSGNLSFLAAPDFEINAGPFNITITATDDGEGALSDTQSLTVNVTNIIENAAPSLGSDTSIGVAENSTAVGNFTATDIDGDNITYTLSGADAALFTIDNNGNVSFLAAPDFESNPGPFSVTITATDDGEGALIDTQNITVNVTNLIENTAPVLGADTSVDVAENTTVVGNFAATDIESDNITYALSGADSGLFSIDSAGNLSFVVAPDFETNAGPFNVTITATDDGEGALFDTQNIAITVTNVIENTAPVLGADTSISVAENTTMVGNFAATDAEGDSIAYTLSGTDAALFNIDAAGNLSFTVAPDFETSSGPFSVTITATDDGEGTLFETQNITVNVTNVIENTAPALGADTSVDVVENTTAVGNFAASDAEGNNIAYTLSGVDAGLFTVDSSGNLSFLAAPDFETNDGPFNVTVTATDDGEGDLFDTQNVTVNITNVIENTAPVLGADVSIDIPENTTAVGNFSAIDAEGDNITYSLSGTDAALFTVDTSGNLSFVSAPDFETNPGPFSVTIVATDDGEATLLDTQNITVSVTNEIENTSPLLGADTSVNVAENTTVVGNFAATDAEADNITYTLSGVNAGLFFIDNSGNLSFLAAPDFEANPGPFSVTITATDDGEGALFDTQNVTVNITNVIENTAPVLGADTSVDIAENTTAVGSFTATDVESDNVTYALSGADAGLFTIDSAGNLAFLVAPDFEANPGPFNVTITATDDGEGMLVDTQNVTVNVTNVVENTAPVLGEDTSVNIAENSTTVGNFAATDAEGNNVTYALSGPNAGLFAIDSSGNLSFLAAQDFETNSGPFNVTITATDDGEGSLSDTQNLTVNVTNVNEPALIDLDANNSTAPNSNYQTTYTEGGSAVRVADIDISITDIDSTQLQSATITITNVETGDLLSAGTLPTGITASAYNPATGTITLSGTASLTAYQSAIRAIQFSNDGSASGSSRNIEVTVSDGGDDSNVATTIINMVLVPSVSISDASVQEPSSGTTTLVFTVSIDQALVSDLIFSYNTADISATGGADYVSVSGGTATIVAGASSTTISVTVNSDANNFEGDETFAVNLTGFNQTVNFLSGAHTISGGVQGLGTIGANNGAPDAVNDSFITSEDTLLLTGNVFSNDSLVDNADYSSHDATSVQGGTVTYNGDGTFIYTPTTGFSGTDSFTYTVVDDDGETDTATVTVEVTNVPVNPPIVNSVPHTIYTENDSAQSLLSGISLSDVDSTTLSSVVVRVDGYIASQDVLDYLTAGTSVNASIAVSGNAWELTLTNGADINEYLSVLGSLTYQNSSENPSTANRTITVEAYDQDYNNLFDSDSGTIMVVAENDAPTVTDSDVFYVSNSANNNLNIAVPFDVDTDDATLVITVTGLPTSVGTVTHADGTPVNIGDTLTLAQLTNLQLDAGAVDGADTFTYIVFDGELTTVGTTTINVGDSEPDANTVYESALGDGTGVDGGSTVATGNLFANDAAANGSTTLDSIEYNSTTHTPVSGVITIGTALGTLTVYADNSTSGFSVGDYEYVLNSADGSGADINEVFTYNFTSGAPIQDTLTITVVDDQPVANDLVEDVPESEEQVFNLVFTLDISTSMNAQVGSTGQSRLDLAKQALVALAREYFDQSTQVNLTVLLFANGAHNLGSYNNFSDAQAAINNVTDNRQTGYSNDIGYGNLTDSTSYNDALTLIEQRLTAHLSSQNPADQVRNISYFLSDGEITVDGTPIGNGFDDFVSFNSISSYSVGIGTGLPSDLSDLNFIHNIDSLGQGNGHVDDALIVSDVSLLESELLSTVPTAFGGNITVDGNISNVEFGADGGFVSSISLELGGTLYTFTYNGSSIAVPGGLTNLDVDGSKLTFNSDDGFAFGTFTFDFSDGSYLFIAPNGAAGSSFNFDFTVVDGDGDSASAVATINIVDDLPDARDDLHTVDILETARGNVITGIGTDGGPKLGTGFTEFAVQGGGVDKVVDGAKVTEFTYKGTLITLEVALTTPPAPTGGSASVAINNSTNWGGVDFSLTSAAGVGFNNQGAGVWGGESNSAIDDRDSSPLTITFDDTELPYGVDNLVLGLSDFQLNLFTYDSVAVTVYDILGNILGIVSQSASNGSNVDLSMYSGVGSVDIDYTGTAFLSDPDMQLATVTYAPTPADPQPFPSSGTNNDNLNWNYSYETDLAGNGIFQASVTDTSDGSVFVMRSNGYYEYIPGSSSTSGTLEPILVDYVLTDSDGQSDTAQLAIHTTDNQITGTVSADSISGGNLNDAIFGDDGDDILSGGAGHDTISGGEGADIISGNADSDYLSGGEDNDELYGGAGNDHLSGDAGNDLLDGGLGDDIVLGGDGNDLIFGGAGNDRLEGGAGDDIIYGGAGNDILVGDDGDDIIFGGTGDDTLTGGDNIDTFIWQVTDAGSIDTVTDFETGLYGDVLDFSDLLQGESADAATLDSYFTVTSDGDDTTLEIDINGDGSGVDMMVVLRGVDLTLMGSEQQILQQLLDDGNLATD